MMLASAKAPAAISSRSRGLPAARCLGAALRPVCPRKATRAVAQASSNDAAFEAGKVLSLTAVASSWMMSGQAQAATELSQLAASDNRFGTIALLFIPALGWVAFNIFQPLLNQLGRQAEIAEDAKGAVARVARKKRSVAGAVGLGAALALAAAQQADAATELSQLAASDNRFGTIALLFIPALGWVGFNIFQPLLNQLSRQSEIAEAAQGAVSRPRAAKRR